MKLTQKQKVLIMLKGAQFAGVRSDTFFAEHLPRAAARVKELRDEGWDIASERDGKYVRYTLRGSEPAPRPTVEHTLTEQEEAQLDTLELLAESGQLFEFSETRSAFTDDEWDAAA